MTEARCSVRELCYVWGTAMRRNRKNRVNPGRWQVERERHRLTNPRPPVPERDFEPLRGAIDQLMKRLGLEKDHWTCELSDNWADLVGDAVAAHSRPGRFENARITVFVDNSAWLSELARHCRTDMLKRLQRHFGEESIRDIRFQLDPDRISYRPSDGRGNTRCDSSRR